MMLASSIKPQEPKKKAENKKKERAANKKKERKEE
jgi:hypothetical protein